MTILRHKFHVYMESIDNTAEKTKKILQQLTTGSLIDAYHNRHATL